LAIRTSNEIRTLRQTILAAISFGIFLALPCFAQQPNAQAAVARVLGFESATLGDRALRYMCQGQGSPAVIIEQGLGNSIEAEFARPTKTGWAEVVPNVAEVTRVCVYDRAGLGNSSPQSIARTSTNGARELHALLENVGVPPPYVFAGHSMGGINARAFAAEYPNEVVGMILIDATHPDMRARTVRLLPPPSDNEPAMMRSMREPPDRSSQGGEWYDFKAIEESPKSRRDLGAMPLIVLSRNPDSPPPPGAPPEGVRMMEALWQQAQVDLAKLSTKSKHIVAKKAGHFIQADEPELVIEAIFDVVEQARGVASR
jgi:pimeloyl-ACP methyl ester carboxylesterase